MFELQTRPAPAALAVLGAVVELREIDYAATLDAMFAVSTSTRKARPIDGLLAACLFVDGKPIGLEALLALPGRFTRSIQQAGDMIGEMHSTDTDRAEVEAEAAVSKASAGADDPPKETARGNV